MNGSSASVYVLESDESGYQLFNSANDPRWMNAHNSLKRLTRRVSNLWLMIEVPMELKKISVLAWIFSLCITGVINVTITKSKSAALKVAQFKNKLDLDTIFFWLFWVVLNDLLANAGFKGEGKK